MSESDDLIERLAREAGGARIEHPGGGVLIAFNPVDLQRFAALVAEECRKACIEVNEEAHQAAKAKDATSYVAGYQDAAIDCDEAIRAKFKEPTR